MPSSPKNADQAQRIGMLLFDGFSNHCVANAIEPLRAANTLGDAVQYRWQYLTLTGTAAQSSSGLNILPDAPLSEASGDLLLVAPSYGFHGHARPEVLRGLRAAARRFDRICGLDTGAWLLAAAGLLDGCRATIHPEEITNLAETFPRVTVERARFVEDGRWLTCSGAMAAFDLMLHLIGRQQGPALALEVEQLFVTRDLVLPQEPQIKGLGRIVRGAVALMDETLEDPLPIPEIAALLGVSQRRLEQAFRAEFADTPQAIYRQQRLRLVTRLARQSDLPFAEIALRAGYRNASAMSRAYRAAFALSPSQARAAARG